MLPLLLCLAFVAGLAMPRAAAAETRSLKLYFLHTGEKAEIAFKKDGKYIPSGLTRINTFLRDWRRNEPTKIDPQLLDLVWEVYQQSGSHGYINVVSAYRSPATNSMLRTRGRGVAKYSQHTLGKAMDFFLPDVKLSKLREIGLKMGVGGVGYYPTSGSPFVHMDTGNVRHWPRMTRQELVKVFPDGKTMHIPTDGKPLPGYDAAVASYKARKANGTLVASSAKEAEKPGFFQRLLAASKQDEADDEGANDSPAPRSVKTVASASRNPALDDGRIVAAANVPVPSDAPAETDTGTALDVADTPASDNGLPGVDVPGTATASDNTSPADTPADGTVELAAIPIPSRRPDYTPDTLLAGLRLRVQSDEPLRPTTSTGLSADEIETLRRTAQPNTLSGQAVALQDQGPTPDTVVAAADTAEDQQTQLALVEENPQNAILANVGSGGSLVPSPMPDPRGPRTDPNGSQSGLMSVASVVPTAPPRVEAQSTPGAAPRTLELALAATTTDNNSARQAINAMIETDKRLTGATRAAAKKPAAKKVPESTAPEPAVLVARNDIGDTTATDASWDIKGALNAGRLADTRSVHRMSEIRAPAYGMNALRRAPDRVLVAGFVPADRLVETRRFTGNSVIAVDFVRFE